MAPSPSALSYIQRSCGIRAGGQSLGHFFMLDFSTHTHQDTAAHSLCPPPPPTSLWVFPYGKPGLAGKRPLNAPLLGYGVKYEWVTYFPSQNISETQSITGHP